MLKTSDHLEFDKTLVKSGKTFVAVVYNKHTGGTIGLVRWYGAWRRYAFFPVEGTTFDADCLFTIARFCDESTIEHYDKLRV